MRWPPFGRTVSLALASVWRGHSRSGRVARKAAVPSLIVPALAVQPKRDGVDASKNGPSRSDAQKKRANARVNRRPCAAWTSELNDRLAWGAKARAWRRT